MLRTSDFDYELDEGLIAQAPLEQRQQSRLMHLARGDGAVSHHVFADLPRLLRPGDLLVVNDTAVIPAKFHCRRVTGGKIEGLFLREAAPGTWEVMLKNAARCKVGQTIAFANDESTRLTLRESHGEGRWLVAVEPQSPAVDVLKRLGQPPLPPYIRRDATHDEPQDRDRYQTVYARQAGAVAAPTAGLHFSHELLGQLGRAGIGLASVTLHVGMGTFLPVKAEDLAQHQIHAEWYELSEEAASQLRDAKRDGRRIVAVGTTSVRVLETVARGGSLAASSGWTSIFIYPPAEFGAVDALITNFHLPRSTLLMLVAAFCRPGETGGIGMILDAYREAIRNRYRFYSYGDAMLIE